MRKSAEIIDIVRFMPEKLITPADVSEKNPDALAKESFFRAPKQRRHAFPKYSSADLGTEALKALIEETAISPNDIDLILYSVAITDYVNIGIGPDIQHRCGAKNATVLNIDTGCVSYISMLNSAQTFIESGRYKTIVILTITNFVSRLDDFQSSSKSWVLGDGATATLVMPGEQTILSVVEESHGENYGLMLCRRRGKKDEPQDYWEANAGALGVEFSKDMIDRLKENAIELVADTVKKCVYKAGLTTKEISLLVTHQPNVGLMNLWREKIGIAGPRSHNTFHSFGNVFQSSLPVTLSDALQKGRLNRGDTVALGTFANGNIAVYSEIGHGTTFKIYLPTIKEEKNDTAGADAKNEEVLTGKERLLVVEDEDSVRAVACAILRGSGYEVVEASNPCDAIEIFEHEKQKFDLLLTDVIMPNMNGPKLAEKLQTIRSDLNVLFMSGYTDTAITHNGILEDGTNFLQKPFMPKSLLKKVRSVLDHKGLRTGD